MTKTGTHRRTQLLTFCLIISSFTLSNAQFLKKKKDATLSREKEQAAEMHFEEGMKEYILDSYGKSLSWFEKSLSIQENNAAAYYMIASIYNKQGNLYKAIQYAEKALKLDETNKFYYLLLAQIYERKQDFNEASKVYLNLLKKVPNTQEHYYDLVAVYLFQNKMEDAIKCYDKIEKYYGISEEITKSKQQFYLKLSKLNEAINEGRKLIDAFPDEPRYLLNQIELLIANEKNEEAEKTIYELLKKEPANPYAKLYLSEIYRMKSDTKRSESQLEDAFKSPELDIEAKIGILISKVNVLVSGDKQSGNNGEVREQCLKLGSILAETHPKEARAYAMNADILVLSGKNEDALANYVQSAKLDMSHFKIWKQIVVLDQELNKIDSMRVHSEKALELFPNQSVFWMYNGLAYQGLQNYKKATFAYEEGKKLSLNDKTLLVQFYSLLGDSYNGMKDYKKSDEAFEEVLKNDANNHVVLNNYSYYLSLRKDKLDYARKMSEKVVKEYPDNATYLDTYAWILYVMKDYAKAKDIFQKISEKSDNGTIVEHYGDVLYQLGEKDKAVEQWKKARSLGDASEFIDKKITDKKLYE